MTIDPRTAALLDRLADPVPVAVQQIRCQLDDLARAIVTLKSAVDKNGEECADYLWTLVHDAELAAEDLEQALGLKRHYDDDPLVPRP